jgi:hypothetical protein
MSFDTVPSKAPNLAIPTTDYNAVQQQQTVNQLRLYFVQVDNNTSSLNQAVNSLNVLVWIDC